MFRLLYIVSHKTFHNRYIKSDKKVIFSTKKAKIKIAIAWLGALIVVSPYTHALTINSNGNCFEHSWSKIHKYVYYMTYIILSCFAPAIILCVIYAVSAYILSSKVTSNSAGITEKQRQLKRLSKVVVLISLVFFVLTMPNAIFHFVVMYYDTFGKIHRDFQESFQALMYVFHTLSHCNSFINPFVYAGMHKTLKKMFRGAAEGVKAKTMVGYTKTLNVASKPLVEERERSTSV